jgi:hypothetical protein
MPTLEHNEDGEEHVQQHPDDFPIIPRSFAAIVPLENDASVRSGARKTHKDTDNLSRYA